MGRLRTSFLRQRSGWSGQDFPKSSAPLQQQMKGGFSKRPAVLDVLQGCDPGGNCPPGMGRAFLCLSRWLWGRFGPVLPWCSVCPGTSCVDGAVRTNETIISAEDIASADTAVT